MSTEQYTVNFDVRFRDLDPMKHVNNAVYATYLEQARSGYFADVVGERLETVDTVIAQLEISYAAPIEGGWNVVVGVRVPELGETSIPMTYEVEAQPPGEETTTVVATGKTVQVYLDGETGESTPIPSVWRDRIAEWEGW